MLAVNCTLPPAATCSSDPATATASAGTVTSSAACTAGLLAAVAVTETCRSAAGMSSGAVYLTTTPLVEMDGATVPQGGVSHEIDQVTPRLSASLTRITLMPMLDPARTVG